MDVFIVKQLKNLRKIRPSASLLSRQRSFLLSEISRNQEAKMQVPETNFSRLLKPAFALAFVLVVFASSLATIGVISAAQNSLPGDPLYVLKTAFEQTQMTFSPTAESRVRLSIKFVNQRIDEFAQITANSEKKENLEKAVKKFTEQLVNVQESMDKLKEKNSAKAAEIAKIINEQVIVYEQTLIKTSEQMAYILPEIDQALIEVNNIKERAEQIISAEENKQESDLLVPIEEEQTESKSIPFEKISE